MDRIGHHNNTRLRNDQIIAPTVPLRRLLAHTFLEQSRGIALLSFSAPDTHLHLGIGATSVKRLRKYEVAPELVRAVELQLRFRQAVDRSISRRPIEEQRWARAPGSP